MYLDIPEGYIVKLATDYNAGSQSGVAGLKGPALQGKITQHNKTDYNAGSQSGVAGIKGLALQGKIPQHNKTA